jgi:hypothetical protein
MLTEKLILENSNCFLKYITHYDTSSTKVSVFYQKKCETPYKKRLTTVWIFVSVLSNPARKGGIFVFGVI